MSDSPDNRPDLRISDTDRDRAAEVLREAHAEGAFGVMGGVDHGGEGPGAPGAPRIRITGVAVMGGIEVKRAPARRSSQGELPSPG